MRPSSSISSLSMHAPENERISVDIKSPGGENAAVDNQRGVEPQDPIQPSGNLNNKPARFRSFIDELSWLFTTKEGLIGDYDYWYLLTPDIPPFNRKYKNKIQPFYAVDDRIPLVLAVVLGLQHAVAMIGGIVAPPLMLAGGGGAYLPPTTVSYLVSTSLTLSGVFSIFQIYRFRILKTNIWIGTGMLSVVGEAFSIVPVAQAFFADKYAQGKCQTIKVAATAGPNVGPPQMPQQPCPEAYGELLGTIAVVFVLQIILSLVIRPKALMRIFPPLISGMVMCCIGAELVASGVKNWAGGAGCMPGRGPPPPPPGQGPFIPLCPNPGAPNAKPWGDPSFIGLGFSVYITIILVERFGSPFLRNCSIFCGLTVGTVIAAASGYLTSGMIQQCLNRKYPLQVPWMHTFPLGFNGSLVLPLFAACISSMVSNVGDIVATADVSGIEIGSEEGESESVITTRREDSDEYLTAAGNGNRDIQERIQGGLTADGIWSVLAALATSTPLTTFAQNNGVIALTSCASRRAGYMCCIILIACGVITGPSAFIVALPNPVIGGMTTFLFTSVFVSGLRLMSLVKWDRRNRFIATAAMTIGLADLVVPNWTSNLLPDVSGGGSLGGFYTGLQVLLSTSYCMVCFVGCLLALLIPEKGDRNGKGKARGAKWGRIRRRREGGIGDGLPISETRSIEGRGSHDGDGAKTD